MKRSKKMTRKNEIYTVNVESVSSDGNGVAHIDGMTVFIPHTAPGDAARVRIVKPSKSYAYARVEEIIAPSPARCAVPCPHFYKCGGCSLMHIKYEEQLKIKKEIINNALMRIAKTDKRVDEMLGAEEIYRYRNKMIFPIGAAKDGAPVCGFYRERSHDIVPMSDCLLGAEFNGKLIGAVLSYMKKYNIPAYDEATHSGVVRRIFTRTAKVTGEIMAVISANADSLPHADDLIDSVKGVLGEKTNIILNINKNRGNLVLGKKNIVLSGGGSITDSLLGTEYEISPHSFFQINHAQTERLYKKALEYAAPEAEDTVMDIYCGIGTISLFAARSAGWVIGVEIVPDAISDAKKNAESAGVKNAEFHCADAAELVPELIARGVRPGIVMLDPPRKGSDERTLSAICAAAPKKIVYVSCNPATLARDIAFLRENGYDLRQVCGVDMFPNTSYVECVVLMTKVQN